MSSITEFKQNGDIKEPFLIGVAGGTASGKVPFKFFFIIRPQFKYVFSSAY